MICCEAWTLEKFLKNFLWDGHLQEYMIISYLYPRMVFKYLKEIHYEVKEMKEIIILLHKLFLFLLKNLVRRFILVTFVSVMDYWCQF
jgi:hypothetical protein